MSRIFDPNTPTELQRQDWTCSIRSTMWLLKSIGIDVTPEDAQDAMSPRWVTPQLGLLNADGSGIVEALGKVWGVTAVADEEATFDEVAAVAGRQPVAIGLRNWAGPGLGHWSAVRGLAESDAGVLLVLANPATGPKFGNQDFTRAEFDARGPASMVTIPLADIIHPETKSDPWQWFSAAQIAEITKCPEPAVRENWPRLVEQLHHCGINSRPTQIAMIATVAIETARTFAPVREAFWLDEDYRRTLRYYPYYGRGYIQLTHQSNYAAYGPKIAALWGTSPDQPDFDLVGEPDRALDPDISAAVSALYFRDHGGDGQARIPAAAAIGNWVEVRRLVQGGSDGLAELTEMATALWALPIPTVPEPPIVLPPAFDRAAAAARVRAILAYHDESAARIQAELTALLEMLEAA